MCPKLYGSLPYHIKDCVTIGETTGGSESKEESLYLLRRCKHEPQNEVYRPRNQAPECGSSVEEDRTTGCT